MNVFDCLTPISACIDHGAIALGKAFRPGDPRCRPMQMAEKFAMTLLGVGDGCDVLARNDKNVHGRLRLQVSECIAALVLVYRLRGDAPVDNLTKNTTHVESL